jgi:hypothetical protein
MRTKALNVELGVKDIYKYYRSKDTTTKEDKVLYDEFRRISYAINKKIAEKMLEGKFIKLPFNLGNFYIRKVRNNFKNLKFDYAHYNKTGEKVVHLNSHSNQYHAKWFWQKISCRIPGHTIYSFIPSRQNKRNLAKLMKEPGGYKKYLE